MKAPAPKGKGKGKAPLQAAGGKVAGRVRKHSASLPGDWGAGPSRQVPVVPVKVEKGTAPVVVKQEVAKKQKKQKRQAAVKREAKGPKKKPKAEAQVRVIPTKLYGEIKLKNTKKEQDEGVLGKLDKKMGTRPLRLLLVGHNPSNSAWKSNHYYANAGNWMWPNPKSVKSKASKVSASDVYPCPHGGRPGVLNVAGIAPAEVDGPKHDDLLPEAVGVGFMDVGYGVPGNNSENFTSDIFELFIPTFYQAMKRDAQGKAAFIGCTCKKCGWPAIVAFVGKKQYAELMNYNRKPVPGAKRRKKIDSADVEYGRQTALPPEWPCPGTTEVWVCPSTSGSAVFGKGGDKDKDGTEGITERFEPYIQLGKRIEGTGEFQGQGKIHWPRFIDCLDDERRGKEPSAWDAPIW